MSDKDDRIFKKLDIIDTRLNQMSGTLIKQETNLTVHMKRSDALEKRVEQVDENLKEEIQKTKEHFDTEVAKERKRITYMEEKYIIPAASYIKISLRLLLVLGTLTGIIAGLIRIFS